MIFAQISFIFCVVFLAIGNSRYQDRFQGNEIRELLRHHNNLRRIEAYEQGIDSMMETVWDEEMQNEAESYASGCLFYRRKGPKYEANVGFAEHKQNYTAVIDQWLSSRQYYDFNTKKCSAPDPKTCAQYLNIVEENGQKIGCGRSLCKEVERYENSPENQFFFVCIYRKSTANTNEGTAYFEDPYTKREQCLQCDESTMVYRDGLCALK